VLAGKELLEQWRTRRLLVVGILTKPASRSAFLEAKLVGILFTLVVGVAIGLVGGYVYTVLLFGAPEPVGRALGEPAEDALRPIAGTLVLIGESLGATLVAFPRQEL
jgi:hypothetical protein